MKNKTFGKKCKCGHFESEHASRKNDFSIPKVIPEMGIIFTHPPSIDEPLRIACKICECKKFNP